MTFLLSHWHKTSGLIQGDISLRAICEGTLVAAAIALAGAAFPAWRCAKLPIADTMRAASARLLAQVAAELRTISCATIGNFDRSKLVP